MPLTPEQNAVELELIRRYENKVAEHGEDPDLWENEEEDVDIWEELEHRGPIPTEEQIRYDQLTNKFSKP